MIAPLLHQPHQQILALDALDADSADGAGSGGGDGGEHLMASRVRSTRKASGSHFGPLGGFAAAWQGLGDEEAVLVAEDAGEIAFQLNEHLHVLRETALFRLRHLG